MSEPTITALVSSTKSTKKKRVGFRPVSKSKAKRNQGKLPKSSLAKSSPKSLPQPPSNTISEPEERINGELPDTPVSPQKPAAKKTSTRKLIPSRKRKQSGITVGVSRGSTAVHDGGTTTAAETPPPSSRSEFNDGKHVSVIVPAKRSQEQDNNILERLKAENPEGVRLSSFCSSFKGKRTKRDADDKAPSSPQKKDKSNTTTLPRKVSSEQTGAPAVQIVDGEIVLQESSLRFPGQRRSVKEVEEEFDVVEEDAQLAIVGASYNSFVNRKGPRHWSMDETKRFYEALRQLGTDFCSMEAFFENRTRKQLKRKYTAELSKNPELVEMALNPKYQKDVDGLTLDSPLLALLTDLSVFNVEVDQKAIEAAAIEEPIPYEPTNVESTPKEGEKSAEKGERIANTSDQWEVVEEDAQNEIPVAPQHAGTITTSARFSAEQQTLWPSYEDTQTADGEFPEPSMEDFFHEHEDPEAVEPAKLLDQAAAESSGGNNVPEKAASEVDSLSLVPSAKKTPARSKKRPKFRSAPRKKK
eukprot:scaffold912_cov119-Cylindrotheca_fusiformis.AAC.18